MGYAHIENLYRNKAILMFKECWAMEKIHGTSAHIAWRDGHVTFFSGGAKHDDFVALFDAEKLAAAFGQPRLLSLAAFDAEIRATEFERIERGEASTSRPLDE
jgi:hypothetical protein